jgi:hypothetical protein
VPAVMWTRIELVGSETDGLTGARHRGAHAAGTVRGMSTVGHTVSDLGPLGGHAQSWGSSSHGLGDSFVSAGVASGLRSG